MKSLKVLVFAVCLSVLGNVASAVEVGEMAPCVVLDHTQNGEESSHCIRDPELQGLPVLIEFFSITCSACQENLPKIVALAKSLKGKATVRLISIDRNEDQVRQYIAKNKIKLEVGFDSSQFARKAYNVSATPTLFLLDQDNIVHERHTGVLNKKSIKEITEKVGSL